MHIHAHCIHVTHTHANMPTHPQRNMHPTTHKRAVSNCWGIFPGVTDSLSCLCSYSYALHLSDHSFRYSQQSEVHSLENQKQNQGLPHLLPSFMISEQLLEAGRPQDDLFVLTTDAQMVGWASLYQCGLQDRGLWTFRRTIPYRRSCSYGILRQVWGSSVKSHS